MNENLDFCSMLFVPADAERFLAKAGERGADALILDLEDAVARSAKTAARGNLPSFIERLKRSARLPVYVRVNNEPELLAGDLEAAVAAGCDGLLMPKVETPAQVLQLDTQLRMLEAKHRLGADRIPLVALIESPLAICNVVAIAQSSKRLTALAFGVEDFGAAMGIESRPEGMTHPAQTVAIAAVAAGLQPLGLPGSVADFSNLDNYRSLAVLARRIGMRGSVCIHPAQVPVLNEVFGGTDQEVAAARRLLEVFDSAAALGKGAVSHEGRMVDEPIAMRARRFLDRHDALKARRVAKREALQ